MRLSSALARGVLSGVRSRRPCATATTSSRAEGAAPPAAGEAAVATAEGEGGGHHVGPAVVLELNATSAIAQLGVVVVHVHGLRTAAPSATAPAASLSPCRA